MNVVNMATFLPITRGSQPISDPTIDSGVLRRAISSFIVSSVLPERDQIFELFGVGAEVGDLGGVGSEALDVPNAHGEIDGGEEVEAGGSRPADQHGHGEKDEGPVEPLAPHHLGV